jgi:hypothetical protein
MSDRAHVNAIVVAILALALVIAAIVIVSTTDVSPMGLRVDGHEVSQGTIDSELDDFAKGTFFENSYRQNGRTLKTTRGAVSATAAAQWLGFRTETALANQVLAREGARVTDRAVDKARKLLQDQGLFKGMSGPAVTPLARFQATDTKLSGLFTSEPDKIAALRKAARGARVEIDPRYGTWNRRLLGICPPSGCHEIVQIARPTQQ